ncbi:hypothetical protein EON66_07095 [archaeon]|nr:MAG: hypothetical protein EON66_07095 [archaeon]
MCARCVGVRGAVRRADCLAGGLREFSPFVYPDLIDAHRAPRAVRRFPPPYSCEGVRVEALCGGAHVAEGVPPSALLIPRVRVCWCPGFDESLAGSLTFPSSPLRATRLACESRANIHMCALALALLVVQVHFA